MYICVTIDHNFSKQHSPVGRLLEKSLFFGVHIPDYKNNFLHGKLYTDYTHV